MKKTIVALVMCLSIFFTGCVATSTGQREVDPYKVAKVVTVSYIFLKNTDKIKPKNAEAVNRVYGVFDAIMKDIETKDTSRLNEVVIAVLRLTIEDPNELLLAETAVDMYWGVLVGKLDFDKISADKRIEVLKRFHKGIEDTLRSISPVVEI